MAREKEPNPVQQIKVHVRLNDLTTYTRSRIEKLIEDDKAGVSSAICGECARKDEIIFSLNNRVENSLNNGSAEIDQPKQYSVLEQAAIDLLVDQMRKSKNLTAGMTKFKTFLKQI